MSQYKSIVVDGCNALFHFYHPKIGFNFRTICRLVQTNCERVCDFLRSKGNVTYIVFDMNQHSAESKNLWFKRRQKEVENERRDIPINIFYIVIETLKNYERTYPNSVRVVTPKEYDADDYIAAIANEESNDHPLAEVAIVSADANFQRYKFKSNVKQIVIKRDNKMYYMEPWTTLKKRVYDNGPRLIPKKLLEEGIDLTRDNGPMMTMYTTPLSVRGTTDSFVLKYKSLYEVTAEIRDQAYCKLASEHMHEDVVEKFMSWDSASEKAILKLRKITLKGRVPSNNDLLANCEKAYDWVCEHDPYKMVEDNPNRAERTFARCAVLAEAVCAYQGHASYIATFGIFWDLVIYRYLKANPEKIRPRAVSIRDLPNEVLIEELNRRLALFSNSTPALVSTLPNEL